MNRGSRRATSRHAAPLNPLSDIEQIDPSLCATLRQVLGRRPEQDDAVGATALGHTWHCFSLPVTAATVLDGSQSRVTVCP